MTDKTTHLYNLSDFDEMLVEKTLYEVAKSLEKRGYNPINQLTGYIMSGDPGYISSYQDARNKIVSIDRSKIIEVLLRKVLS